MSEASTVVTSENLAEFNAQRLGLAAPTQEAEAVVEETPAEPVEKAEQSEQPEAEKEATPTEDKKSNPKLEKRFSKLSSERDQARLEAQREREAREALEARLRELEQKATPQEVVSEDKEPQPTDFADAFEYAKELAKWSSKQALLNRDKQLAEEKAQLERKKIIDTWTQQVEKVKAELPDYEEVVESADVAVPDYIRDAIIESDVGAKILYHLADDSDFAKKLVEMTPAKAIKELGKLEAKFEASPKTESEKSVVVKSKAPAPISPIKGGSSVDVGDINAMSYKQYREARLAGKIR